MGNIRFRIESDNGHDEVDVPEEKLAEEVNKQLVDGKWVTIEKKDGSSEILTSPVKTPVKEEKKDEKKADDWQDVFGKKKAPEVKPSEVASVTATSKMKGG